MKSMNQDLLPIVAVLALAALATGCQSSAPQRASGPGSAVAVQVAAALRADLDSAPATVERHGAAVTLTVPAAWAFELDQAPVHERFAPQLARIAATLNRFSQSLVEVTGHTDSFGLRELNRSFSAERAAAVCAALVGAGVAADRCVSRGEGENGPIADNATADGRRRNRRVEIRVTPLPASGRAAS